MCTGNQWRFMRAICHRERRSISRRSAGCGPGVVAAKLPGNGAQPEPTRTTSTSLSLGNFQAVPSEEISVDDDT